MKTALPICIKILSLAILVASLVWVVRVFDAYDYWNKRDINFFIAVAITVALASIFFKRNARLATFEALCFFTLIAFSFYGLIQPLFATCWLILSCYFIGLYLVRSLRIENVPHAISVFLGLAILASVLPAVGWLTKGFIPCKIAIQTIPLFAFARRYSRPEKQKVNFKIARSTGWMAYIAITILVYLGAFCLIPDVAYDSQVTHLSIPFRLNLFSSVNLNARSVYWVNYPLAVDHLFALVTSGVDLYTPKILNYLSLFLFSSACMRLLGRRSLGYAIGLSLCCACLPLVTQQWAQSFIDLIWAEFLVLGLLSWALFMTRARQDYLVLALIFFCAACSAKLITGLYLIFLAPLLIWQALRLPWRLKIAMGVLFFVATAWCWIALFKTGNPIFPLYNDVFHSTSYPIERFADARWRVPISWKNIWQMTAHSDLYGEVQVGVFGLLWLVQVPIALMCFRFLKRNRITISIFFGTILVGTFAVLATQPYYRYIMPSVLGLTCVAFLSAVDFRIHSRIPIAAVILSALVGSVAFVRSQGWIETNGVARFFSYAERELFIRESAPQLDLYRKMSSVENIDHVFIVPADVAGTLGLTHKFYENNSYSRLVSQDFATIATPQQFEDFKARWQISHFIVDEKSFKLVQFNVVHCQKGFEANGLSLVGCVGKHQ